jgi:putative phosphoribosyl transferase
MMNSAGRLPVGGGGAMFLDRSDAGRQLAAGLATHPRERPLVLGLPRGGVPVAEQVAIALSADLDVLVVRKIGAPNNPEFGIGAVGEDGARVIDHGVRRELHISSEQVDEIAERELAEVSRRVLAYRGGSNRLGLAGRNVILVDDGLATGSTAAAAVRVARHEGAAHVTVAVPVGSAQAVERIVGLADDVVCLETPTPFYAVGQHYRHFDQVADAEVVRILTAHPRTDRTGRPSAPLVDEDVAIPFDQRLLPGHLTIPHGARGLVLFAHGSGSSRLSPRNVAVARQLQAGGLGTLLFDLLNEGEADDRRSVFDIELLAERLVRSTAWVHARPDAAALPIGYFGASTGAAAALVAAAQCPTLVTAVVSRGGRPDLAGEWLSKVEAPTLLIVGGHDYPVIDLNREAQTHLRCVHLLEIVRGATHLFEEPGALAQVAVLARDWFTRYL